SASGTFPPSLAHRRATRRLASRRLPVATAASSSTPVLLKPRSFGSRSSSEGTKSPHRRTEMKPEQIKEITEKASQQLVAALNAGPSDALASYLKAIARFHRYSLHN